MRSLVPAGFTDVDPRTARRRVLGTCAPAPGADARFALVPLVVVDLGSRVARGHGALRLAPLHLLLWERRTVRIPRGACVVLRTGRADDEPDDGPDGCPGLSDDATGWLVDHRGALAVGSDRALDPGTAGQVVARGGVVVRCDPEVLADVRPVGSWAVLGPVVTIFCPPAADAVPAQRARRRLLPR